MKYFIRTRTDAAPVVNLQSKPTLVFYDSVRLLSSHTRRFLKSVKP